ncbi:hypothetical protein [Fodinicola feengrottensis]|uniref:hypothetical protein n=1 Tax=Fodinicola feengrottensis TaxID=435914 RepID=UPI0031CF996F
MRRFVRISCCCLAMVLVLAGCAAAPRPEPACRVSQTLVPSCGVWWGVAANPLAGESWDQALLAYESRMGRRVDIAHFYHRDRELFPTADEIRRADQRFLLENWKPEAGHSWAQVAAGAVDGEIDREAAYLKANFTKPFFLVVHHEPENEVDQASSGFTAKDYAAMFRHVVVRLRSDGVRNAVTVMNYLGTPKWGGQPWFDQLYPGDDVVDWVAEDPYVFGSNPLWRTGFAGTVNRRDFADPSWPGFYDWAMRKHPGKPIILAEWGVDEQPGQPAAKSGYFAAVPAGLRHFPAVKALVYWNAAATNPVGATRIDSSGRSLTAFRSLSGNTVVNVRH